MHGQAENEAPGTGVDEVDFGMHAFEIMHARRTASDASALASAIR